MFTFFTDNNLISPNQSAFRPKICKLFDERLQVRWDFLDISTAFDKVWPKGLLLKLNRNSISEKYWKFLLNFFSCPKQQVFVNGQYLP